ncbi:TIGR03086 family metal-binding protein [Streptomyces decoyicus]|uniref:TIGR03086 family metal-binding protein n=1 Tax=Streptomyces decoyicus TaxID=249567 RepID=UPI0033BC7ECE
MRSLRDLGIGPAAIRSVLHRESTVAETAGQWADALDAQIRTLQLQRAVLRAVAARGSATEELPNMTELARLSARERRRIITDFVEDALDGARAPAYRSGLLAAVPDLPDDPTPEQIGAWTELAALVREPELRAALRRLAEYSARTGPVAGEALAAGETDPAGREQDAVRVAELMRLRGEEAVTAGLAPDSPAAEPVIAELVAAWLPTQAGVQVTRDVGALVAAVRPEDLGLPTPCAGWSVRQLLDHMVWENLMATSIAEDDPRGDHAADHLGDDHRAAFEDSVRAALAAFTGSGMLHRTYGPYEAPGAMIVQQVVAELLAHGWDLARATGAPRGLAPEVAEETLAAARRIYGAAPRTEGSSFAPERPAPPGAGAVDRLAAHLGRDPA